jgi:hypothetical protein
MATAKEIQQEVLTMQEDLLRQANDILSKAKEKAKHSEGLKALGFIGAAQALDRAIDRAKWLDDLVDMYSFEYPGLKFIPQEVMDSVCRKYGLAIGHVSRYIGEVPEWALAQIAANKHHFDHVEIYDQAHYDAVREKELARRFELAEEAGIDTVTISEGALTALWSKTVGAHMGPGRQATYKLDNGKWICVYSRSGGQSDDYLPPSAGNIRVLDITLAAPRAEMRLAANEEVMENGEIRVVESQDPIVCKKVDGGFIVVAAWGEEGQDPRVFNTSSN